jgi:hypothetical protein
MRAGPAQRKVDVLILVARETFAPLLTKGPVRKVPLLWLKPLTWLRVHLFTEIRLHSSSRVLVTSSFRERFAHRSDPFLSAGAELQQWGFVIFPANCKLDIAFKPCV